jgi:hypothetical protein
VGPPITSDKQQAVDRALVALKSYVTVNGYEGYINDWEHVHPEDKDMFVSELICDLLHLAQLAGRDPHEITQTAMRYFTEEADPVTGI